MKPTTWPKQALGQGVKIFSFRITVSVKLNNPTIHFVSVDKGKLEFQVTNKAKVEHMLVSYTYFFINNTK